MVNQPSLVQVAKGLMVDTRDPRSKPSCFTFPAKFISKINEADSLLPFSQKKKNNNKNKVWLSNDINLDSTLRKAESLSMLGLRYVISKLSRDGHKIIRNKSQKQQSNHTGFRQGKIVLANSEENNVIDFAKTAIKPKRFKQGKIKVEQCKIHRKIRK